MKYFISLLLVFAGLTSCQKNTSIAVELKTGENNLAYKWGKIALEATANDTEKFNPRPTVTSRYLGLFSIALFDAWSRYDEKAVPVYLKNIERRPENERSERNKEIAISYAAYGALKEYFYSDSILFGEAMRSLGLDPNDHSLDPNTPQGIGNLAAKAVIEARRHDGSNQYGDAPGSNGTPYFDYTGYQPVNSPDKNIDGNRWQPKYFSDGKGGKFAPACLTPFWQHVKPFGLDSSSQLRPGPPPLIGSEQLLKEVQEVIDLQSSLTNEQKALVEFMRDGPKSVQQAGHWFIFAQFISVRDNHNIDDDVKMYFLCQTTAMDAFIAAWDSKMFYDFARPYALVHQYFQDQVIKAWGGPEAGMVDMKAQEWRPYSPETFLCPPFPSYVSGHSCVSGACAEALKLYTQKDTFGMEVKLVPGALTEPNNIGDTVTIKFPTLTETAEMAGISRVLGGYHIQSDNIAGLELGRAVAHEVWKKCNHYILGN